LQGLGHQSQGSALGLLDRLIPQAKETGAKNSGAEKAEEDEARDRGILNHLVVWEFPSDTLAEEMKDLSKVSTIREAVSQID